MAVQLADVLASGDLTVIKKGGPDPENEVLTVADAAVPATYKDFVPQDPSPAEQQGRIFFDDEHSSMAYYPGYTGVLIQVGQERVVKVKNITGIQINNGQVCRLAGADPVTGFPQAVLAQADIFANAVLLGAATHDIANGAFGLLTVCGTLHKVDTSAFAENDVLYLSDTTPGAFSTTIPTVISRIGQVLVADAAVGAILLSMASLITIPKILGILNGIVAPVNVTLAYRDLVNYTDAVEVNTTLDAVLGSITVNNDGRYRSNLNFTFTVPSAIATRTVTFRLWDMTDGVPVYHYAVPIPRDATAVSRSSGKPTVLVKGHAYVMQIITDTALTLTFTEISWDVDSIFVYP